ncbi:MAG: heavy metal translocating P-type ATPase [Bacilli bacterium]|nr:heavy metal translocating P-type ATPase [Bacilli bacterium]
MANINKSYKILKCDNKNNYRKILVELKKIEGVVSVNIDKNTDTLFIEHTNVVEYSDIIKPFKKYEKNVVLDEIENIEVYRKVLKLKGIDCAQCALKIENLAKKNFSHKQVIVDFSTERFIIETTDSVLVQNIVDEVSVIAHKVDPRIVVMDVATRQRTEAEERYVISKKDIIVFSIGALFLAFSFIWHIFVDKGNPFVHNVHLTLPTWISTLISYLLLGHKVIYRFFRNIINRRFLDENFLMTVASIGAIITGHNFEAVLVMLLYQIGTFLQEKAVNHSRKSISALLSYEAKKARLKVNGEALEVEVESVIPGDILIVKNGEMIPVDGIIVDGKTYLDTKALTGESLYRNVKVGDEVLSGSTNLGSVIEIKAIRPQSESTMTKILDIVENAGISKAKTENFITKFAKVYTPVVVIAAVLLILVMPFIKHLIDPSLALKDLFLGTDTITGSIYMGMIFLVISCPCALVISIPLTFFGGIGIASRRGILIKGSNYLEALNNVENVIFDKTGTLTYGTFGLLDVVSVGEMSKDEILRLAAYTEYHSTHPIGISIVEAYGKDKIFAEIIEDFTEIPSRGVRAIINGAQITVGNSRCLENAKVDIPEIKAAGLVLYVLKEKTYVGYLVIGDTIRKDADEAINYLRNNDVKSIQIFTGDSKNVSISVANTLGVDEVYYELLPAQKVEKLEEVKEATLGKNAKTVYVGDGINDAPVISLADVGIAMGGSGSEGSIAIADVVIMSDNLTKLNELIKIAKTTRKIVVQNIILALSIKIVVLLLTVLDLEVSMWLAIFSDVGVSLIAILNSLRVMGIFKKEKHDHDHDHNHGDEEDED